MRVDRQLESNWNNTFKSLSSNFYYCIRKKRGGKCFGYLFNLKEWFEFSEDERQEWLEMRDLFQETFPEYFEFVKHELAL